MRTQKDDWLNARLARIPGMLVSGHASFAERLGLPPDAVVTLRWLGNRRLGYQPLLVIEARPDGWPKMQMALRTSATLTQIRDLFRAAPLPTLFFSSRDAAAPTIIFEVSEDGGTYAEANSEGLVHFFGARCPQWIENPGTSKDTNKSHNDGFQTWTGTHLSRFLAVSDIDALNLPRRCLYELKRVAEPVANWEPYLDESSQYNALRTLAQQANCGFFALAYNLHDESSCAQYRFVHIDNEILAGACRLLTENGAVRSDWRAFESRRRRQTNRNY